MSKIIVLIHYLDLAHHLEHDMEQIKGAIHHVSTLYTNSKQAMQEGCELTNQGFESAIGILHGWNEILARFV